MDDVPIKIIIETTIYVENDLICSSGCPFFDVGSGMGNEWVRCRLFSFLSPPPSNPYGRLELHYSKEHKGWMRCEACRKARWGEGV